MGPSLLYLDPQLKKYGMPVTNKEKTQQCVEQMYYCNLFTKMEVRKWKCKSSIEKTWKYAKTYFKNLFIKKQAFQDNMGAVKAGLRVETTLEKQARDYHLIGKVLEAAPLAPCPTSEETLL